MNLYETIFIFRPNLPQEAINQLNEKIKEKITKNDGEIISLENWGQKRLAYEIKGLREGIFSRLIFRAPSSLISELDKDFKIDDKIVRQMTLRTKAKKEQADKQS